MTRDELRQQLAALDPEAPSAMYWTPQRYAFEIRRLKALVRALGELVLEETPTP